MTSPTDQGTGVIPPAAHRILWIVTWVLFALGMLEWFIQGANRPVDPVVSSGALAVLPLVIHRITH